MKLRLVCAVVLSFLFLCRTTAGYAITYNFITIDVPLVGNTFLYGINDSGQITGQVGGGGLLPNSDPGFLYSHGIVTPILAPGSFATAPLSISNSGLIAGYFAPTSGGDRGFVYNNGVYTILPFIPSGVNDAGDFVGNGFLLINGVYTPINGYAMGINDADEVVGNYGGFGGAGFLYHNGVYTPINGSVAAINSAGNVVGSYSNGSLFLYDNGVYTDVTGVPNGLDVVGINDAGVIVGYFYDSSENLFHGFIASPAPKPSTWAMMLLGFAGLGFAFRQSRREVSFA
jgi:hypothetical protein